MEIISGQIKKPFNVILYGVPGIGKSTWASKTPTPLFIGAEENDELTVQRLKKPTTWDEFLSQVQWIIDHKPNYETLVVDTIDSIEKILHRHILSKDPKGAGSMSQAHGGYGKAYEKAETEFLILRSMLQRLRDEQGKGIILLAHSIKTQATDTILGLQYDTYEMSIHKKAQAVLVDWTSCVLFGNYIVHKVDDDNTDKVFAIGEGERVVLTEKRPGFLAKNRYRLPFEMPLDFSYFLEKYHQFYESDNLTETSQDIYDQCVGILSNISDDDLKVKVLASMEKSVNDTFRLKEIRKRLEQRAGM